MSDPQQVTRDVSAESLQPKGFRYALAVYTPPFTFAKREFDDAFHPLDQVTATTAKREQSRWLAGYLCVIALVLASYWGWTH